MSLHIWGGYRLFQRTEEDLVFLKYEELGNETLEYEDVKTQEYQNNKD